MDTLSIWFPKLYHGDGIDKSAVITLIVGLIGLAIYSISLDDRPYSGFPMVEAQAGKKLQDAKGVWIKSAKSMIYETLQKTGRPFQVIGNTGPLIILPPKFMDEVRNDDRATFGAWLKKDFFTNYPGFQGFRPAVDNEVFNNSVRIGLTQAIGQVTDILSQETVLSLNGLYKDTGEWQSTAFNQDALTIIARLSSRIFLPEPLCHDEEWLKIAVDYTVDFFTAAFVLRMFPAFMRPLVHWFLPQTRKIRKEVETATKLIEPELARRRKLKAEALREGRTYQAPVDALTWLDVAAEKQGIEYNYVWGQLNYSLGAIHTTTMTFVYVVYDLIERPQYIELLREEINSVWKEGEEITKAVLYKLKLMDSFMKESQRLSPVTLVPINRVAHHDFKLSDGTVLPKGAVFGIPVTTQTNEDVYPNHEKFDGHRFYDLRQQPGSESKHQFVTTSNDHISFGHGKHACPGRFFASNEIKITLMHLLTKYDMKFPEGQTKPRMIPRAVSMQPNPDFKILIRRRK